MVERSVIKISDSWCWLVGTILLLPLVAYTRAQWQRPPLISTEKVLSEGITYQRRVYPIPRIHIVHSVKVDLTHPDLEIVVTPGQAGPDGMETVARTTSEFLQEFQVQVAINAGFFYPFEEKVPWNYTPKSGDRVNVVGLGIANGVEYSPGHPDWGVLCFFANNQAEIISDQACPEHTVAAVSGIYVLEPKQQSIQLTGDRAYGRTLVALDQSGETLWMIVVDGKQPHYSEGITMAEAELLNQNLGADRAINLDGGGSTTMVIGPPTQPQVINAPIHTKWPMRERPVATHLGFRTGVTQ